MTRKQEFDKLKETYNFFMFRDTDVGIFSSASLKETFEFFKKIKLNKFKSFLDIGSGDGRICHLASLFTTSFGCEFDEKLNKKANSIKRKLKLKTKLLKEDFYNLDFSEYDIIFVNPDASFHLGLETKLIKEARGKIVVYNDTFLPRILELEEKFNINGFKFFVYSVPEWTKDV